MHEDIRHLILQTGPLIAGGCTSLLFWLPSAFRLWLIILIVICACLTAYTLGYDHALRDHAIQLKEKRVCLQRSSC